MGNAQDLWALLTSRLGQWVSRDDINFVGGSDASRRMREIRERLSTVGTHRLDRREDAKGRFEYRLTQIAPELQANSLRHRWKCVKCGQAPLAYADTQASMNPNFRLGKCVCGSTLYEAKAVAV